jgi:hypothetical protein
MRLEENKGVGSQGTPKSRLRLGDHRRAYCPDNTTAVIW